MELASTGPVSCASLIFIILTLSLVRFSPPSIIHQRFIPLPSLSHQESLLSKIFNILGLRCLYYSRTQGTWRFVLASQNLAEKYQVSDGFYAFLRTREKKETDI